jgi:hypothetical protein
VRGDVWAQGLAERPQATRVELLVAEAGPLPGEDGAGAGDRVPDVGQMLLGVEEVSTIWWAPGKRSSARCQIHAAPSPRTTRREAWSKPRRGASRSTRCANGENVSTALGLAVVSIAAE